jgi:PAS domain S-box-containing protein
MNTSGPDNHAVPDQKIPLRDTLATGILFGVTGFAINWFKLELFFNIDFLFGSIVTMLALMRYGLAAGTLAALVAATCTWHHWQQPWAIIIFTAEALLAGLIVRKRQWELLTGVICFWLTLGLLLVWLFYFQIMKLPLETTLLIALKQGVNGVFNTLIAMGLSVAVDFRSPNIRRRPSLYQVLFTSLSLFVLIPSMGYLYFDIRRNLQQQLDSYQETTARICEVSEHSASLWLTLNRDTINTLARLVESLPHSNQTELQRFVDTIRATNPEFRRIGIFDNKSITRAFSPLRDDYGASTIGVDLSDRHFIRTLQAPPHPFVFDVDMGVIGIPRPRLILLAPIINGTTYQGAAFGIVDFSVMQHLLDEIVGVRAMAITLVDQKGRVVVSTRNTTKPLDTFSLSHSGTLTPLEDGVGHWIPEQRPGVSAAKRWFSSSYVKALPLTIENGWKVVAESSIRPKLEEISRQTSWSLGIIAFLMLTFVSLSRLLAARFSADLQQLEEATQQLPLRISSGEVISWPAPITREIAGLTENFQSVATAVQNYVAELVALNDSLEQRVEHRTLELASLNRDFVSFLENTTDFVYFKDAQSRIRFCSQTMANVTGHASWRDMIGKHDLEVFPADTARIYTEEEIPIFRDGTPLLNKIDPYYDEQGEPGWVNTNKWPVFDQAGKVIGIFGISRDITESKRSEEELRKSQRQLKDIIEFLPDATMAIDRDKRIFIWNRAIEEMTGIPAVEMIGKGDYAYTIPFYGEARPQLMDLIFEDREEIASLYPDIIRVGEMLMGEVYCKALYNNKGAWVFAKVSPLHDHSGIIVGAIESIRDISESKRMDEELQQALETSRSANITMDRLLKTVAHEFRTPLGLLTCSTDILDRYWDRLSPEKRFEQHENIRSAASQLTSLINSVVSFNQLGTGAGIPPRLTSIGESCRTIANDVRTVWGNGQDFEAIIAAACDTAMVDEVLFRRVLENLLTNAFRYTPGNGSVSLHVWMQENQLHMLISDTGIGIPEEDQRLIFQAFFRSRNVEGRRGLGLGLSIVQDALTELGGSITLTSKTGTGTTMAVTIPIVHSVE